MYEKFEAEIEKLNERVEVLASQRSGARLLMTHPGVGPITALATEVFLGDPARNELFVFDLQAHTDSGRMVGDPEIIAEVAQEPHTSSP